MGIILGERIIPDPARFTEPPDEPDDLRWFSTSIDGNAAEIGYELADGDPILVSIVFAGEVGPLEFDPDTFCKSTREVLIERVRKHEGAYS